MPSSTWARLAGSTFHGTNNRVGCLTRSGASNRGATGSWLSFLSAYKRPESGFAVERVSPVLCTVTGAVGRSAHL